MAAKDFHLLPYRTTPCRRGSSLTELLVVVAVVAVLAGLITPGLRTAIERAKTAGCQSNLRQIAIAVQSYAADNGTMPDLDPVNKNGWRNQYQQMILLRPYISDLKFFRCPAAKTADSGRNPDWAEYYRLRPPEQQYYTDYKIADHPEISGQPVARFTQPQWVVVAAEIDWTTQQRHGTGQNLAFLDGHVVWMSVADYNTPETALRDIYGNYPWFNWGIPR